MGSLNLEEVVVLAWDVMNQNCTLLEWLSFSAVVYRDSCYSVTYPVCCGLLCAAVVGGQRGSPVLAWNRCLCSWEGYVLVGLKCRDQWTSCEVCVVVGRLGAGA